jgi:hypothetical protein
LSGIYDLTLLNQVLTASGRPTVSAGGLGKEEYPPPPCLAAALSRQADATVVGRVAGDLSKR